MIELALLGGLGALGYVLASQQPTKKSTEGFTADDYVPEATEEEEREERGHGNQVPFFGAKRTQSMYSGATDGILDSHAGTGKEYFQKREVKSLFDTKPAVGNPFGNPNESDFYQSRMVTGQRMNNVFPVEQVQVGPGVNDGYTNIPKGGYNQQAMREFALPKTTDELRVVGNEKVSYSEPMIQGTYMITQPGLQADVKKNKPDRFVVTGMDRANTAVGVQTATKIYPGQPMKEQARESTSVHHVNPSGASVSTFASYIRAFTEPYQEFMRLTAEGRPNTGLISGGGASVGAGEYNTQNKYDMDSMLTGATRFNTPLSALSTDALHMGSFRFNEPLSQSVNVERNGPEMLSAFKNNPYTQKLDSI